jgi:hypothetical protein
MSWTAAQLDAELRALEACADRARIALACTYSSAAEFEAEIVRARRPRSLAANAAARLRMVLAVTAGAAIVMLVILTF